MEKTRMEMKRIGAFSMVKTCFLLGGVFGFILGFVNWGFLALMLSAAGSAPIQPGLMTEPEVQQALTDLVRVGGVILPLLGGVVGSGLGVVGGYLIAVVYNLGARILGGLEYEIEPVSVTVTSVPVPRPASKTGGATPLPGHSPESPDRPDDNAPSDPPATRFE